MVPIGKLASAATGRVGGYTFGNTIGNLAAGGIQRAQEEARLARYEKIFAGTAEQNGYSAMDVRAAALAYDEFRDAAFYTGGADERGRLRDLVANDEGTRLAFLDVGAGQVERAGADEMRTRTTTLVDRIAGSDTAAATAQALSTLRDWPEIVVFGQGQSTASPTPDFLNKAVDVLAGVGEGVDYISQRINDNPLLHYSLVALDIASGPVSWAAREIIAASPVGAAIEHGVGEAASYVAGALASTGANVERVFYAAGGAIFLGTTALGVRKALTHFGTASRGLINEGYCFIAGTLVATAAGLRPIESINFGELVLARDDRTGETALKPVARLIRNDGSPIWNVVVSVGGGAEERIGVTAEHPWRLANAGGAWRSTSELNAGDLIERSDGEHARVVSVNETGEFAPTFNFEVAELHTYFVGENSLWVHNSYGPVTPGQSGTYGALKAQKRAFGEVEPLDMDHQPSFAAQVASREAVEGRRLNRAERAALKASTPAVASPRSLHQETSPTYGGRNSSSQIAEDAANLETAAARDRAIFEEALKRR